jgi:hypothetical protein
MAKKIESPARITGLKISARFYMPGYLHQLQNNSIALWAKVLTIGKDLHFCYTIIKNKQLEQPLQI